MKSDQFWNVVNIIKHNRDAPGNCRKLGKDWVSFSNDDLDIEIKLVDGDKIVIEEIK